jgi:hypothetical protein
VIGNVLPAAAYGGVGVRWKEGLLFWRLGQLVDTGGGRGGGGDGKEEERERQGNTMERW